MNKPEIEIKIAEYASKLKQLNGPEDKRVKKRVLQALGKLKKKLAECEDNKETLNYEKSSKTAGHQTNVTDNGQQLTRKQLKAKLKLLNRELADYAQKKQLKMAQKRFSWGVRKGMTPDKHTYANLINCYVRCHDLQGALKQLQAMESSKVTPNIVIYTTILKGYCDCGDMKGAKSLLFNDMAALKLHPTVRTLNTFVRGCSNTGAVQSAIRAFRLAASGSRADKKKRVSLDDQYAESSDSDGDKSDDDDDEGEDDDNKVDDACGTVEEDGSGMASLYEHTVALLCQALHIQDASSIALEAVSASEDRNNKPGLKRSAATAASGDVTTNNASIYLNLAKATAFLGMWTDAQKWLNCALVALEGSKTASLRQNMQQKFQSTDDDGFGSGEQNQKQSSSSSSMKNYSVKRERSMDLFLRHRRAEIEAECELLQSFVSNGKSVVNAKGSSLALAPRLGLYRTLSRLLYFGYDGKGDLDIQSKLSTDTNQQQDTAVISPIGAQLAFALRDKFGLDRISDLSGASLSSSAGNSDTHRSNEQDGGASGKQLLKTAKKETVSGLLRAVPEKPGYIDYKELFRDVLYTPSSSSSSGASNETDDNDDDNVSEEGEDCDDEASDGESDMNIQTNKVNAKVEDTKSSNQIPIKLEICSGSGEWVVAHAAADLYYKSSESNRARSSTATATGAAVNANSLPVPKALWLSLELRCDRVYDTLCRSVVENLIQYQQRSVACSAGNSRSGQQEQETTATAAAHIFGGLRNLAILGGDASQVLPTRIAPSSVSAVYINHPEPPERTSGEGESQGKHLLTQEFFEQIYRILTKDGTVTIVTDNLPYGQSLLRGLAKTAENFISTGQGHAFESVVLGSDTGTRMLQDSITLSGSAKDTYMSTQSNVKSSVGATAVGVNSNRRNNDDSDNDSDGDGDEDGDNSDSDSDGSSVGSENNKNTISRNKATKAKGVMSDSVSAQRQMEQKSPDGRRVLQLWRGDSAELEDSDVSASSYFDRLWDRGQKKRRWFIVLKQLHT